MSDEAFVVHESEWDLLGVLAGLCAFLVMCLLGLGIYGENPFPREPDQYERIFIWACVGVSSLGIAVIFRRLIWPRELYRFDNQGVSIRAKEFVRWEEIRAARMWNQSIRNNALFTVRFRWLVFDVDPEFEHSLPIYKVWLRDFNFGSAGGTHTLTAFGSKCLHDELIDGFNRFAPEYLKVEVAERVE